MSNIAWYNDNQFRDYPFLTRTKPITDTDLPHSLLVDCGIIMEIDSGFNVAVGHHVYLDRIVRLNDVFFFHFKTNAPDSEDHELVFQRAVTANEFEIEWADTTELVPPESTLINCQLNSRWSGFLVTGNLAELVQLLPSDGDILFLKSAWLIEPAKIQNLADTYLRTVNLANTPRLLATVDEECDELSSMSSSASLFEPPEILVRDTCIKGPIWFAEGYNCRIAQDNGRNTITINAGEDLGDGQPCDEVPLTEDEMIEPDSPFLTKGPGCKEIIQSINGIGGADITIRTGSGYRAQPDPDAPHRLIIARALSDFALCANEEIESSLSSSSLPSNGVIPLP